MVITKGLIMLAGGGAGAVICLILLIATGPIFRKQRKKLLERLQDL